MPWANRFAEGVGLIRCAEGVSVIRLAEVVAIILTGFFARISCGAICPAPKVWRSR